MAVSSAALAVFIAAGGLTFYTDNSEGYFTKGESRHGAAEAKVSNTTPTAAPSSPMRRATRLRRRLVNRDMHAPSVETLAKALEERRELLSRTITISVDSDEPVTADVALGTHPEWLALETSFMRAEFALQADAIERAIERGEITDLPLSRSVTVLSQQRDRKNVLRATTDGIAKPGFVLNTGVLAERIVKAAEKGEGAVQVAADRGPSTIRLGDKTLTLLATGMSDFDNSPPNRIWNVHKAFDERMNNIIVPDGETFSFNAALDAPVTLEKGWKEALGLFGGGAAMTPGAGICQGATTTFRAALLAGLPIVEKRNHSLFVDHYEFYGIGLDATIFPGVHDMRFRNDTGNDIVIQAYTEGINAYVSIYGVDDGRETTLDGPYFVGAKDRPANLRALGWHDIGWVRTVTNADGSIREESPVIARYAKPLWGSLVRKYADVDGMELVSGLML